ncbi:unnamed protein product [Caenorhabditis angaria]|uniref:C-type lectin domain-containing protein n=1 Tax=Caenorhabditis angaria TaxID=860376 RepID=A0A9P1IEA0_9PELO|nr:unnamed protein product [Caenorhabditis angaria]
MLFLLCMEMVFVVVFLTIMLARYKCQLFEVREENERNEMRRRELAWTNSEIVETSRTASSKNRQTSGWCLKIVYNSADLTLKMARELCAQDGAVISNFENSYESNQVIKSHPETQKPGQLIRIDGYRKFKCYSDQPTFKDPDCQGYKAFQNFSNHNTDPTFTLNNFNEGYPDYLRKPPDDLADHCLMIISTNQKIYDMSCVSNTHYNRPYRAVLCGKRAEN